MIQPNSSGQDDFFFKSALYGCHLVSHVLLDLYFSRRTKNRCITLPCVCVKGAFLFWTNAMFVSILDSTATSKRAFFGRIDSFLSRFSLFLLDQRRLKLQFHARRQAAKEERERQRGSDPFMRIWCTLNRRLRERALKGKSAGRRP